MTPLENVNRLYSTYRSMGLGKDVIVRKLKAQFSGAKFVFKGSTLYVSFGGNTPQKVIGSTELSAAQRLIATEERKPSEHDWDALDEED